jgi:hypothetical protein
MINQVALCKLITTNSRDIVNLKERGFQYCNGYIVAECDYVMDKVVSKLIKVGALRVGKELKPNRELDLTKILEPTEEMPAFKTDYLRQTERTTVCVFKVGEKYYLYNKNYVDVFENVTYTATLDGEKAILRVYQGTELQGMILNMRIKQDVKTEMQQFEA